MSRFRNSPVAYLYDIFYMQFAEYVLKKGQSMGEQYHGQNMGNCVRKLIDEFKNQYPEYCDDLNLSLPVIINQLVYRTMLQHDFNTDNDNEIPYSRTGLPDEDNFTPCTDDPIQ